MRARLLAAVLCASMIASALPSLGAEGPSASELATARERFDEGLKLEDKGDWAGALVLFQKVAAVRLTPQVRFHLGLCLENLGRLVEALNEFRRAESDAAGDTTPSGQIVLTNAGRHIADLKARIPRLKLEMPAGETLSAVILDGSPVASTLLDAPILVDPGKHSISVRTTDGRAFDTSIDFEAKSGEHTVTVMLPKAAPKRAPTPESLPAEGRGPWPWLTLGVSAAAFVTAGVMYKLRSNTMSELDAVCGADRRSCPYDPDPSERRGHTYTTMGEVMLGVGTAAAMLGVLLLVWPSSKTSSKQDGHRALRVAPGALYLVGSF